MPLVGGSVSLYPEEDEKTYCMDQNFKAGLKKAKSQYPPYQALGYILKRVQIGRNLFKVLN